MSTTNHYNDILYKIDYPENKLDIEKRIKKMDEWIIKIQDKIEKLKYIDKIKTEIGIKKQEMKNLNLEIVKAENNSNEAYNLFFYNLSTINGLTREEVENEIKKIKVPLDVVGENLTSLKENKKSLQSEIESLQRELSNITDDFLGNMTLQDIIENIYRVRKNDAVYINNNGDDYNRNIVMVTCKQESILDKNSEVTNNENNDTLMQFMSHGARQPIDNGISSSINAINIPEVKYDIVPLDTMI